VSALTGRILGYAISGTAIGEGEANVQIAPLTFEI
jgi:hypothetical protein